MFAQQFLDIGAFAYYSYASYVLPRQPETQALHSKNKLKALALLRDGTRANEQSTVF